MDLRWKKRWDHGSTLEETLPDHAINRHRNCFQIIAMMHHPEEKNNKMEKSVVVFENYSTFEV